MELWATLKEWELEMEASPLKLDLGPDLTSVPASITNYVVSQIAPMTKLCVTIIDCLAWNNHASSTLHRTLALEPRA
jgi:hypothetical protein